MYDRDSMMIYNKELELYYNEILSLRNDTDFRPLWKGDVTDINACRIQTKHFLKNVDNVQSNYAKSLSQLGTLKHDLQNNLVSDSSVVMYVKHETGLVKKINKAGIDR